MFFCMTKADYRLIMDIDVSLFPSREVPDEYFWANQLVIKGRNVENKNYIFSNKDSTKTQSLSWIIDLDLLHFARLNGFLFIRRVERFLDKQTYEYYSHLIGV